MRKKTIAELKRKLKNNLFQEADIEKLKKDPRKGVQQIVRRYEQQKLKKAQLRQQYFKMLTYEKRWRDEGFAYIAGVDEAGRGPIAGPLVAASVILPEAFMLLGINDSKQLTTKEREAYAKEIKQQALSYHISYIGVELIDRLNILEATKQGMLDALNHLNPQPDLALIDAVDIQHSFIPTDNIIKGDEKSITIAAASILAKVSRDQYMDAMHEKYPMYNFAQHKGYGTKEHIERIKQFGISPIHRRSFAPVSHYL